jgi:LysR family glycine cleavage system transcriptional activator
LHHWQPLPGDVEAQQDKDINASPRWRYTGARYSRLDRDLTGRDAIRRLPPLNALRSFEAAARHGSFNKAADELYVTPSAVSHQVKTLEDFLEVRLFLREKRRVSLTSAGERYLASVQLALDEIDSATRRLMASPNSVAVTISVAPAFLTRWLVPRIGQFQTEYPDVELRLSAAYGPIDFDHSDTDMAVNFGRGGWRDVESTHLLNVRLVPVCSPALLTGEKPLNTPEDLKRHTLIRVADRPDEWPRILRQAGVSSTDIGRVMTFSSTSLAMSAAMEGVGIALGDEKLVEREVRYGQLAKPFDLVLDSGNAFFLVYPKGRALSYGMKAFHDWVIEAITHDAPMSGIHT